MDNKFYSGLFGFGIAAVLFFGHGFYKDYKLNAFLNTWGCMPAEYVDGSVLKPVFTPYFCIVPSPDMTTAGVEIITVPK